MYACVFVSCSYSGECVSKITWGRFGDIGLSSREAAPAHGIPSSGEGWREGGREEGREDGRTDGQFRTRRLLFFFQADGS